MHLLHPCTDNPAPKLPLPPACRYLLTAALWSPTLSSCPSVKRIPSPIPDKKWYLRPYVIALVGGLLPFGSIFIEMYFIFTSFWNYKVGAGSGSARNRSCTAHAGGWAVCTLLRSAPQHVQALIVAIEKVAVWAHALISLTLYWPRLCLLCTAQVYYVYGFFLLVFLILLIVTVSVASRWALMLIVPNPR